MSPLIESKCANAGTVMQKAAYEVCQNLIGHVDRCTGSTPASSPVFQNKINKAFAIMQKFLDRDDSLWCQLRSGITISAWLSLSALGAEKNVPGFTRLIHALFASFFEDNRMDNFDDSLHCLDIHTPRSKIIFQHVAPILTTLVSQILR